MIPTETPGSSSDVPKRSKTFFKHIGKKQVIYIVLPLLLINAGLLHTVVGQVKASGKTVSQVKDETTSADAASAVDDTNTTEDAIVEDTTPAITTYKVQSGDTLSGIADKFNISINTIRWANDLTEKTSKIAIGDELVILPVSGVSYTVKKGDTLSGIAVKFDASQDDILKYNDIAADAIKVGMKLIIPNAEPIVTKAPAKKPTPVTKTKNTVSEKVTKTSDDTPSDDTNTSVKFINPIPGSRLSQLIHDGNAVDFAAPVGTTVRAAATGTVIIARNAGYNGGYGKYIVINHPDGSQTLYGHLSQVSVSVGDNVEQGDTIALSGNTGKSTGAHLHFLVKNGGRNPFAKYKVGTYF